MGVSYVIKLYTLVQAATVISAKYALFLQEQTHVTRQGLAPGVGDYVWVMGNKQLSAVHLKCGCWDQLLHPLIWMEKFHLKAAWFWLILGNCTCFMLRKAGDSINSTKAEGAKNWDFCKSFDLCPALVWCYTQVLRNRGVGLLKPGGLWISVFSGISLGFSCRWDRERARESMHMHIFLSLLFLSSHFWWVAKVEPVLQLSFQQEL